MKAALLAVAAGLSALGAAFGFAAELRTQAALGSHERPRADLWLEPIVPVTPTTSAVGRKLFLENCAHCHAADATGDEGPDLHGLQVSDRYIARMIREGEPHEMPSFAKKLGGLEVRDLTAYLRTLQ